MNYRRFGRTEIQIPVFSCGGMRYQKSWNEKDGFDEDSQKNLEATIERALEVGINHIETARGYGTSEMQLGTLLPRLPRDSFIFQTKIGPSDEPEKFRESFETSMDRVKLDHLDLLGIHGINTRERLEWCTREGGCIDIAAEWKAQGRIRHLGFSTHGPLDVILDAVNDGRFDYVNLHWYWSNPLNGPAIEAAKKQDMGVFIISPSDKGGKLYEPPEKLSRLCEPLSPMLFNDLWCLSNENVHTLSLGAARPSDFDEHLKSEPYLNDDAKRADTIGAIEARLSEEMEKVLGAEWTRNWNVGLPWYKDVPGEINVFEILRLGNLARAYDMVEYGKMRYNLLGKGDHWFGGNKAETLGDLKASLADCPVAGEIPHALAKAHEILSGEEVKRLGSH